MHTDFDLSDRVGFQVSMFQATTGDRCATIYLTGNSKVDIWGSKTEWEAFLKDLTDCILNAPEPYHARVRGWGSEKNEGSDHAIPDTQATNDSPSG